MVGWSVVTRLVVVLWLVSAAAVAAQIGGGAVAGTVVDQAGALVPGAAVTITAVATNLSRTAVTGEEGTYVLSGLAPGVYRLLAESSGFRPLTREAIRLATGETVRIALRLELGAVAEAVTVTADAPLRRSGTSGLGHVVDNTTSGRSRAARSTSCGSAIPGGRPGERPLNSAGPCRSASAFPAFQRTRSFPTRCRRF
jgi:hypothetical protein